MNQYKSEDVRFEGEEAGAGYASPTLDLIAAGFLIALATLVMIGSVRLKMPGDLLTAPGLLPFVVAASLLVMALGLGAAALARRRAGIRTPAFEGRDRATDLKSVGLAVTVGVYIAALQLLAFRSDVVVLGLRHTLTAFEPVTIIALTVIIKASWRGPLWIAAVISVFWTLALALVFAHVFNIPLPGSF